MERNAPVIAKKIWSIMRVAFFMLRKGICKRKILMDLNLMMKRGKIAGKALRNIMFHLHHHHNHHGSAEEAAASLDGVPPYLQYLATHAPKEYEFSSSDTPMYQRYFTNKGKNINNQYYMPSPHEDMDNIEAVNNMFDMMMSPDASVVAESPLLPGQGSKRSPAVRQLRITDSPFPVQNSEDGKQVDAAAEEFINKFYSQLKQQKYF